MFVFAFWDFKFGVLFVYQERFMICLMWSQTANVLSSTVRDSWKSMLLIWSASGPYFIFREPYCIAFYSISSLLCLIVWITVCASSQENHVPQLWRYLAKKKHPFQIPVHSHIFIFGKEKKDSVWFEMTWREHKTDPALPRGVNGIYSVYFLHAVHINPQRCRYTAHIMFHSALVFQGNIHHTLSHTELSRDRKHFQSFNSKRLHTPVI